ncbi:glycosyl transferase family 1 [Methanofervidicoccus sp. A16]|uniref:glycosyltransferase family 4 protein n=1 Tax=Methanofervidicoccus sp. A16 TaxID=2607662 RepID=UPI001187B413|nr:glycosyltransferase family 1 protein [Methanofervidicoccus sp. A16]AXI24805.1 glycosyl transferase family 1 [Methanofervidicoccus sp. A16]
MNEIFGKYRVYYETATRLTNYIDFNEISYFLPKYKIPCKTIICNLIFYPKIVKNSLRKDTDLVHVWSQEEAFIINKFKFNTKTIVTCLDIIPILYKKNNGLIYASFIKYSLKGMKKSDRIITISKHVKNDLVRHFSISEEKINVIYLGVNEHYKPIPENEIEKIKYKYNLKFPFILYVGSEQPRKNFPTLIKAFYKLKTKYGFNNIKLVKAGNPQISKYKRKHIMKLIDKLNLQKDIIFTGYVPEEDLPALYNAADLFVYPSIYEGFGLPPLEAMACGTPVITSNTSSLPEVVGDAGIMVDPYDVDGLSKAMYEVLTNDGLREELRKKGLERAKLFSWKECAEEHLKVYEEVYNMK